MEKIGKVHLLSLLMLIFLSSSLVFAKGVQVQAFSDSKEVTLEETLTVTVKVSSEEDFDVEEPRSPDFDGFQLINTWANSMNSSRLVQGPQGMQFESEKAKEFHYQLAPRKAGSYPVGAFEVTVDGKTYRTSPIMIRVLPAGTRPSRPQAGGGSALPEEDPFQAMQDAEDEVFRQLLQSRQRLLQQGAAGLPGGYDEEAGGMLNPAVRTLPKNPNEAFFIQVEVDKTSAYEGEQVTVNWYLLSRGQMESLDRTKFPSLKGFWKEVIEESPSLQFRDEVINGVPYRKALLASHALFPIKAGVSVIDEFKIKSKIRTLAPGAFGNYFGKAYEYTKSSEVVKIQVKPLPNEGRPADFTGAVGEFDVRASIDGTGNYPVNQPFSLRLRFEGAGNAKLIDLPNLNLPPNLEVYDTRSEAKFFKNGRSYKEFEVLVIPRSVGPITIPEIKMSFFNPELGQYYSKSTLPITLNIDDNPNAPVGMASPLKDSAGNVTAPAVEVIALPAWQKEMSYAPAQVQLLWWWWIPAYLLILVGLGTRVALVFGWGQREKTLQERVAKRLKVAEGRMQTGNIEGYSSEMLNVWYLVLGKASDFQGAALPVEKLLEGLSPSLRREFGEAIRASVDFYQLLSFAPKEMVNPMIEQKAYLTKDQEARQLIDRILEKL